MEEKEIKDLEKKAKCGDVWSMIELAEIFRNYGNEKKSSERKELYEQAMYYYELASDRGEVYSRLNLANMLILDFYSFVGMNRSEKTSDMFFKLRGAPKKIIKGLGLMFSIIDHNNINADLIKGKTMNNDLIIETTAFYVYFITNDFLYIRNYLDRGKFLDPIKDQIEEYGKKSELIIKKHLNTAYHQEMLEKYRANIVIR
jgi:hypothetical protein